MTRMVFFHNSTPAPGNKFSNLTRMHSSRMRTGRSLTVSEGGVVVLAKIWRHHSPPPKSWRPPRKIGDLSPPKNWRPTRDQTTPPPVDRITDACKNITLAQLHCGRQVECIPVGCVLTAAVAATRCQCRGVLPIPPP